MSGFLRWSSRIYGALLLMYPLEMREQYGLEMAEVFAKDLDEALGRRSAAAVLRVWWHAVWEVPPIAIPARWGTSALRGPLISLALHVAVAGGIFAIVTVFREGVPHGVLHGLVRLNLRPQ